jgi:hypothetical protein
MFVWRLKVEKTYAGRNSDVEAWKNFWGSEWRVSARVSNTSWAIKLHSARRSGFMSTFQKCWTPSWVWTPGLLLWLPNAEASDHCLNFLNTPITSRLLIYDPQISCSALLYPVVSKFWTHLLPCTWFAIQGVKLRQISSIAVMSLAKKSGLLSLVELLLGNIT